LPVSDGKTAVARNDHPVHLSTPLQDGYARAGLQNNALYHSPEKIIEMEMDKGPSILRPNVSARLN